MDIWMIHCTNAMQFAGMFLNIINAREKSKVQVPHFQTNYKKIFYFRVQYIFLHNSALKSKKNHREKFYRKKIHFFCVFNDALTHRIEFQWQTSRPRFVC
jgi:hypothetical protein